MSATSPVVTRVRRPDAGPPLIGAAVALFAFYAVGIIFLDGFLLDLGSLNFPSPRYVAIAVSWTVFGGWASILLAVAISRALESMPDRRVRAPSPQLFTGSRFLLPAMIVAFVVPLVLRTFLLKGAPLTDDEGAYRFSAQLIASGRLWVPSPTMKLFFDQNFMINDGRLYSVYFPGWPALMALGIWLHAVGAVNPLLSAATIPALYQILRRATSEMWSRFGVLLFLASPFIQLAAATLLSHTSCLMALTWATCFLLRTHDNEGRLRDHALFGAAFSFAFCIRPQSALALGTPLVVSWLWNLRNATLPALMRRCVAFAGPVAVSAVLFCSVLWAQNGSAWVGYARYMQYVTANHYRFTSFGPPAVTAIPGFNFSEVLPAAARTASGLLRLNFDLFGWPSSFLFLAFAGPAFARGTSLFWWMCCSFVAVMFFQNDWGIDTFGPLHAFELALPVIVLSIIGAKTLTSGLQRVSSVSSALAESAPRSLLTASILAACLGFVPIRLEGVREISAQVNRALKAPERENLHNAVIFSSLPFVPPCSGTPRHFVLFRPVNDPDLKNDVLWVNTLDLESDRQFMKTMPGRTGYVMQWTDECAVRLTPLSSGSSDSGSGPRR